MRSIINGGLWQRCVLSLSLVSIVTAAGSAWAADPLEKLVAAAFHQLPDDNGEKTHAPYFFVLGNDDETDDLPLKSSFAAVDITGVIANVELEQVYTNEGDEVIEAIYIFPASTHAAVHGMRVQIGDRTIEAVIQKKKQARKTYEKAKKEGKTAALLDQHRPNVFQMSVANILPGDRVAVYLNYTELLTPKDNVYDFVLPAVVGPRYVNGETADEEWTANPHLHEGEGQTFETGLDIELDTPIPIASVRSSSHDVEIEYLSENTACIAPKDQRAIGTKDFVLRYKLAGNQIQTGLLLHEGEEENHFALMLAPPDRPTAKEVVPREYIFIVDVSGSMHGFPLDTSKSLIRDTLDGLLPRDSFNILTFAGGNAVLSPMSMRATPSNVDKAKRWLDSMSAGGGTELLPALTRAFSLPQDTGKSRIVVVATDGYVSIEKEAFALVEENIGKANLFAFGIGSGVNRHLIDGLAASGGGEPVVVMAPNEASKKATDFLESVRKPVLQGIRIDFEGIEAYDIVPEQVGDLFSKKPILVLGKYKGGARGRVVVSGHSNDGVFEEEVRFDHGEHGEENTALPFLWARHKIADLADHTLVNPGSDIEKEVTNIGLAYHLVTDYTSFVAVDNIPRAKGKKAKTVKQPLALPDFVSDAAVGGDANSHGALMGKQVGSSFGYGGLGIRGTGRGGGGTGHGTIGTGGYGRGAGQVSTRSAVAPRIKMGSVVVKGSLARDVIRRIIRRQLNRLRYCYEQQLQQDPNLKGKVVIRFNIAADGSVQGAQVQSSTLGNATVEQCLVKAFQAMTFPAPPDSGIVVVSYPLVFKPAKNKK